jgi:nucleoside-diphosphate-sugar epimerase
MTPSGARLVVTGASGFIGRVLVRQARERGQEVVALSRGAPPLQGHYNDLPALAGACEGADAVVHLAARAHRGGKDEDFDGNVQAMRAVAQAARAARVPRFVLLSSIGVNGNRTQGKPFDERDAPAPVEAYARSKLRCEQELPSLLAGSATAWTIVRPPLVYGPEAPGNFGMLVGLVQRGMPVPVGAVRNARSLVGVQNLCDAILLCATHPAAAGELFLLADGEDLSTPEIVGCIARGLGRPPRLVTVPPALLKLGARLVGRPRIAESLCDSLQVDASKVRRVLGWTPGTTTRDGIARAMAPAAGA